jgi:hydroxymethylbilane synthase
MINLNFNIATRRSKLAQVQTDTIISILKQKFGAECGKILIDTTGDIRLDVTLDKIGGKGLFVKDIEEAILEGRADAAVHSMKDVPYEMPKGFEIAAIPLREDVRDVFISMSGYDFYNLPKGARIGTSSLRRASLLKVMKPDIEIVPIRGNVQTRIDKIEKENLDGIVLAAAGIKRLEMESIVTNYFEPTVFVPAVGQGALGVEILSNNPNADYFRKLDNQKVRMCVEAERSFMRRLNGGCHIPIGAYADTEGDIMYIVGIFEINGKLIKKDIDGNKEDYLMLGERLAEAILKCC